MIIYHSSLSKDAAIRYKQVKPNEKLHALVSYGRRNYDARYFLVTDPNLLDGLIMDSGTWTLNQNYTKFKDTIKPYYRGSKQFYVDRDLTFNRFTTIIKQICHLNNNKIISKIVYNKSKYEIEYYIANII